MSQWKEATSVMTIFMEEKEAARVRVVIVLGVGSATETPCELREAASYLW